jgi:hypothetical protein
MLPKIDVPVYKLILPSTKKEIHYRGFTVKEEKILLMAVLNDDLKEVITAIKQIVNNCILEDNFDVASIPYFDFEYIFIQLRIRSVGSMISLRFRHNDENCGHINEVELDLNSIEIGNIENNSNIMLTDTIGVKMKYPTIETIEDFDSTNLSKVFDLVQSSVEYIFDENKVYSDFTEEELKEYIGNLSQSNAKKLVDFIGSMPTLSKKLEFTCGKCKTELSKEVKGLSDFFA